MQPNATEKLDIVWRITSFSDNDDVLDFFI